MVAFARPKGIKAREVPDEYKWPAGARLADAQLDGNPICLRCVYTLASRAENCNKGVSGPALTAQEIKQGGCTKVRRRSRIPIKQTANVS